MTRDLRKYAKQTNVRLLIGFFLLLLVIGIGLIYLFYGRNAALMGLICTGAALLPAVLIWLVLWLMGYIVKKANE
jgi:energy-converting hydrogenase Eha subunit E